MIAALAALLAVVPVHAQQARPAALRAEIDSLTRAMEQAFTAGNMLEVARFYADDGVLMGPRPRVKKLAACISMRSGLRSLFMVRWFTATA